MLFHDGQHGTPLIEALARHGDGLPANVLPLAVNEVTQVGLEAIVAAFAYGAAGVRFLLRAKPLHDIAGLSQTIAMADADSFRTRIFGTAALPRSRPTIRMRSARRLRGIEAGRSASSVPATFKTVGKRRDLLRFALTRTASRRARAGRRHRAARRRADRRDRASMSSGCTLCLSCVSACPTGALLDDPDRPVLKFVEDACVQCGLCKSTCPEKVITLTPQIDFRPRAPARGSSRRKSRRFASAATSRSASRARSTGSPPSSRAGTGCSRRATNALDAIRMCADCRVITMSEQQFDPFVGVPERARRARPKIICANASGTPRANYLPPARARKSVSALRSSGELMRCSGILVPGV